MALQLVITSYHKITPGQCSEMTLRSGILKIGRGPDNDWVLPDPDKLISSQHCSIQYRDGIYLMTDNSTNGVELVTSGIRLRRGNSERINDGEVIRIGDYEICARINQTPEVCNTSVSPSASFGAEPISFEALMGGQQQAPAPVRMPAQFERGSAMDTLPDLFDFLAPGPVPPVTQPDHVPAQQHDFRPPVPSAPPVTVAPAAPPPVGLIPEDWDLLGTNPATTEAAESRSIEPVVAPSAAPAPEPEIAPQALVPAAAEPGSPLTVESPTTAQPTFKPQATPSPAGNDLLAAFLDGAGISHLRIDNQQAAAQMHSLGRSYRLMVEGMLDVLRARASLKGEFRIQQTLIQPLENNPLKFAPNADEALLLLLRGGNQAFMAPDQAVSDGFDDLKAHQLAVMAGMQAAIGQLLKRFEPAALEARLEHPGGLAGLLSGSRQVRYWQQFTELYGQIASEAQDDFQDLFGREFSRAYEEHSAKQRRS
jgi:type VI secretion system protein